MKVLANDGLSAAGVNALQDAGFTVITDKVEQDQLIDYINNEGVVALLVRSATTVRQEVFDACPGLKFVGRGGVGMDNIDVEYGRNKGVTVENTPAASSRSVAEMVFAHLFGAVRFMHDSNRQMPANGASEFKTLKKKYGKGIELYGRTIGIVGFGRIGQHVAKYALGCGMKVKFYDPMVSNASVDIQVGGKDVVTELTSSSMDEVIAESDVITLHVPKPADGAVINAAELSKMKDGVVLVNLARGGVIDEDALLEALNSGKVGVACLDVFENEPTPRQDLLSHPNVSLSPHIGAATGEAQDRIGTEIAAKIVATFETVA